MQPQENIVHTIIESKKAPHEMRSEIARLHEQSKTARAALVDTLKQLKPEQRTALKDKIYNVRSAVLEDEEEKIEDKAQAEEVAKLEQLSTFIDKPDSIPVTPEGEQKPEEAQPQATEKLSLFGEIGQEFNVTVEKMKNAKTNGERFTIVMEALGNVWAKIQHSLSSMGSGTLLGMSKLAGFFAGKEAADFLRGLAGTEKAILSEQLKGNYVLTPDIKPGADKRAMGVLQAKFAEYKKPKTAPAAAPAVQPAPAATATPAPAVAPVTPTAPVLIPTFEQYVAEVVVPKVDAADWSSKARGEDGKLKLTLSEIVAQI